MSIVYLIVALTLVAVSVPIDTVLIAIGVNPSL